MQPKVTVRAWSPWWRALEGLAFPDRCIVCGGAVEVVPLCGTCARDWNWNPGPQCERCAVPLPAPIGGRRVGKDVCPVCLRHPPRFEMAVALGPYQGPLRQVCLRLKHPRSRWLASRLIDLLLDAQGDRIENWLRAAGEYADQGRVRVVPVPLHWWRQWRRGFNQSEALAESLAGRLGLPVCRALRRARPTPQLKQLSRRERRARLWRAFRVRPNARAQLAGCDVILVDDILTTGATCNAASRTLQQAGVRRVLAVVLGRAKEPK